MAKKKAAKQESSASPAAAAPEKQPAVQAAGAVHGVEKAAKPVHMEFGGPIGAAGVVFGLPIVIYMLYFLCNDKVCMANPMQFDWASWKATLPSLGDLFSWRATAMILGWMAVQVLLERILPGATLEGTLLPDKTRLTYVMNGHLQFWIVMLLLVFGIPHFSWDSDGRLLIHGFSSLPIQVIYDEYVRLIGVAVVFSTLLSIYLYKSSFWGNKILAKGGNTGYAIYDFFIGRELNPRIGTLDLKEFCELRPGLVGWLVINLGMGAKQWMNTAAATGQGSISLSMLLIILFQGVYIWDAQYNEPSILTTMDITSDGFGFMLAFGDLAWVPFIYSLQARYLVDHDPHLSLPAILAVASVHALGFYIFRSANSEKDAFRRDPNSVEVRHLTYLPTKRGTKLLTSGWWGMARKINYTGDWLITLSWCMLCGFDSPIPYFQALYFAILLIHRAIRDDEQCHEKYGDDWLEYKRRVPYWFIPYVI